MKRTAHRSIAAFLAAAAALPASAQDLEPGFVRLFDGETLTGWVTRGGRYDGDAEWAVEEGCIVGRESAAGQGGLLYTERAYASFHLKLDVWIEYPFDSGVFVRMAPEGKGAQITLDHRPGGEIGAIYSDGFLAHQEAGAGRFERDGWNEVDVRCTGFDMRLELRLNGELLTTYEVPPDTAGYAPTGLIGLQVHGGGEPGRSVRFRNVRVRELPLFGELPFTQKEGSELLTTTEAGRTAGWRSLLDGSALDAWEVVGDGGRYELEDGTLAFRARGGDGHLRTRADYRDFRLRMDFQMARMANSGVFLRAARDGANPAYSGCEVQILDDFDWEEVTGTTLKAWQFTGSLYGSVPPGDRGALSPTGEWNTFEILYRGTRLAVALNGRTLYDVDTRRVSGDPPFARRAAEGFIGLQHHGAGGVEDDTMVRFRNVFVQRLDATMK